MDIYIFCCLGKAQVALLKHVSQTWATRLPVGENHAKLCHKSCWKKKRRGQTPHPNSLAWPLPSTKSTKSLRLTLVPNNPESIHCSCPPPRSFLFVSSLSSPADPNRTFCEWLLFFFRRRRQLLTLLLQPQAPAPSSADPDRIFSLQMSLHFVAVSLSPRLLQTICWGLLCPSLGYCQDSNFGW